MLFKKEPSFAKQKRKQYLEKTSTKISEEKGLNGCENAATFQKDVPFEPAQKMNRDE